ncbi:MAG: transcription antitermination factor NusB [Verrucomicrobiales bacterium]|nr:transcription antitermination factor NusB [Verrucomicrobiales bacterium]
MSKRREGREAALQMLYSLDHVPAGTDHDLKEFWELRRADEAVQSHATALFRGIQAHREEIDARIAATVQNFRFERLAVVDRNILRLAVFEMFHDTAVPPVVSMNEAIEIAKRFGGEDSPRFINGVLDRIIKDVPRPIR